MRIFGLFVYLAVLALLAVFRMAYVGWLGPYLLTVAAAAPALLLLLSLPSMGAMRLRLEAPGRCLSGSEAQLRLVFSTGRFLPLSRVLVKLEIENRYTGEIFRQEYRFRSVLSCDSYLPLPTKDCGLLLCRIESYACYDLLGLFYRKRQGPAPVKCAVLPPPQQPAAPPNLDAALDAALRYKPKYGGGYSEEHDLRAYQPGDTVNSIHWKLSSKTDSVIVREPLVAENNEVYLVLARAGVGDSGLKTLRWLSEELCRREIAHILVSARQVPIGNEEELQEALTGLLSAPMAPPVPFDASLARCVFVVSGEEVTLR